MNPPRWRGAPPPVLPPPPWRGTLHIPQPRPFLDARNPEEGAMAGVRGRPKKAPESKMSKAVTIRFTPSEWAWIRGQAKAAESSAAAWVRGRVLRDEGPDLG